MTFWNTVWACVIAQFIGAAILIGIHLVTYGMMVSMIANKGLN